MKRFLSVLVASMFLASAAYAAEEKKTDGKAKAEASKSEGKAKGKSDEKKAEGKAEEKKAK